MESPTNLTVTFVASIFFVATSGYAANANRAEFTTMKNCLSGIKNHSGQELKVVTDSPNEVSGFLSDGKGFGCQRMESGTKGTYFEGWYLAD